MNHPERGDVLADIIASLTGMEQADRAEHDGVVLDATKDMIFVPNPGPQTDAYLSPADITLFGGRPGGGKTALGVGLALNEHHRSLLIRKSFSDLEGLLDTTAKIVGSERALTRGSRPKFYKQNGGLIHFAGLDSKGNISTHQGVDHDFIYIDECAQLPEKPIRMLLGWLRTDRPGQRCRVLFGSNPPLDSVGDWLIDFFAPWLDNRHPYPAKPGELRYFLPGADGKDYECAADDTTTIAGLLVRAQSRTFIPSTLEDNPYYDVEEYAKTLAALPIGEREILMSGNFMLARKDQQFQAIPAAWVREAQERWTDKPPRGVPQCAMGVDASGGGDDPMTLAKRHDGWYAPIESIPGKDIPMHRLGKHQAGLVLSHRRDESDVVVDMGGGYGGPVLEQLAENIETQYLKPYKGAEKSTLRTREGKLGFPNTRSAAIWKFREALDPNQEGGSPIALPDDPMLVADLTAPTYRIWPRGIEIESKEDVCERLKRSTDRGDAVVMAWHSGQKHITVTEHSYSAEQGARRRGGMQVDYGPRRRNGMRRN